MNKVAVISSVAFAAVPAPRGSLHRSRSRTRTNAHARADANPHTEANAHTPSSGEYQFRLRRVPGGDAARSKVNTPERHGCIRGMAECKQTPRQSPFGYLLQEPKIRDVGYVMGAPTGRPTERNTVLVSGRFGATSKDRGSCYAITAKYDGRRTVCWETITSSCAIGLGELVSAMSFLGVGEFTEVSTSQLKMLKEYARASEYQVERQ